MWPMLRHREKGLRSAEAPSHACRPGSFHVDQPAVNAYLQAVDDERWHPRSRNGPSDMDSGAWMASTVPPRPLIARHRRISNGLPRGLQLRAVPCLAAAAAPSYRRSRSTRQAASRVVDCARTSGTRVHRGNPARHASDHRQRESVPPPTHSASACATTRHGRLRYCHAGRAPCRAAAAVRGAVERPPTHRPDRPRWHEPVDGCRRSRLCPHIRSAAHELQPVGGSGCSCGHRKLSRPHTDARLSPNKPFHNSPSIGP